MISYIISDVENVDSRINVVVFNEGASESENIQGSCVIDLPAEQTHDQLMYQAWFDLLDASGRPSPGKIRLGIQYIYDQVRLFETLIQRKEEECRGIDEELKKTEEILDKTSGIYLIND